MKIIDLRNKINAHPARSAWEKGVKLYANELISNFDGNREFVGSPADKKDLFNGTSSWYEYSYGGCSLIYDSAIAKRLCTKSELKRCHNGIKPPNSKEQWLDIQTKALHQAALLIMSLTKK